MGTILTKGNWPEVSLKIKHLSMSIQKYVERISNQMEGRLVLNNSEQPARSVEITSNVTIMMPLLLRAILPRELYQINIKLLRANECKSLHGGACRVAEECFLLCLYFSTVKLLLSIGDDGVVVVFAVVAVVVVDVACASVVVASIVVQFKARDRISGIYIGYRISDYRFNRYNR
jgi:hypothetical protein